MWYLEMGSVLTQQPLATLSTWWQKHRNSFCRVDHLKEILLSQIDRFLDSETPLRCIVFVQQRITTHILEYAIASDPDLTGVLTCDHIYATSSPASASLSLTAEMSRKSIDRFREGKTQVLFSTAVAEEGMDIPAANCVIRFDAVTTPVSLVQSRGRARQSESSFLVMAEMSGRTVNSLQSAEKAQQQAIAAINGAGRDSTEVSKKRKFAQLSRVKNARSFLTGFKSGHSNLSALAVLNTYSQKVAGEVMDSASQVSVTPPHFRVSLSLSQYGMDDVVATGEGASKKLASQVAATQIIDLILADSTIY